MTFASTHRLFPALALVLTLPALAAPGVDTYTIDPVHSQAGFTIRHLVTDLSGGVKIVSGTILLDAANLTRSSVEVTLDPATINTSEAKRDEDLRSPKFFDVQHFPTMTFKSTAVAQAGDHLNVTGLFTMHGITKTIVIPVNLPRTSPGMAPGTFVVGFGGKLKLKRSDYGISTYASPVGDIGPIGNEVTITLSVEADKVQTAQ